MGANLREALAAQGLDETDLEMNRAGRVSEKQVARQVSVRRRGALTVWSIAVFLVLGCGVAGGWGYMQNGTPGIAIFMSSLGLVTAALPLGVYYAFRFANPAKVAASTLTRIENAEVGLFLPTPYRGGIYAISLNGKRYSGFASDLKRAHLGARVNAYVVAEYRIVVALEPID